MFLKMFFFECRYFMRQPSFYITATVFFVLPLLMMTVDRINFTDSNALKNSAYSIAQALSIFSYFAMFLVVNFVADTATRNHSSEMEEILYSKPITPLSYHLGRFLGSYFIILLVFCAVPTGLLVGTFMPWVDAELYGPTRLGNYLTGFLYLSVPTLFVLSCCFYALALRFQSMMVVYLMAVGLFIAYEISDFLFVTPGFREVSALLDPFGGQTFEEITRYWTVHQKNNETLQLSGLFLQNRLLWLGIGLSVMWIFGGFKKSMFLHVNNAKTKKLDADISAIEIPAFDHSAEPDNEDEQGGRLISSVWKQFFARSKLEFKQVILSPSFGVLLLLTCFLLILMMTIPTGMFGTSIWPLTQTMVRLIQAAMGMLMMIIITYYSAEVVWGERSSGMGDIIDSMPVHNIVFWTSKLMAVWSVIIVLVVFGMLVTISRQLISGYENIHLSQYLVSLFFFSVLPWMMQAVLAFFLQVLSSNKYVGMAAFVLYIFSGFAMEPLGLSHNQFSFSSSPAFTYSDMNGYGWALVTQSWYMLYWGALSLALAIMGYGIWHRGPQQKLRNRLAGLKYNLGIFGKTTFACAIVVFVMTGTYIHYNTRVLNNFVSESAFFDIQADYEKSYAQYLDSAVPTITKVNANVEIYPEVRKIVAQANIVVENRSPETIKRFLVSMPDYSPLSSVYIEGASTLEHSSAEGKNKPGPLNSYWFEFDEALRPGEKRLGNMKVLRVHQGFVDSSPDLQLVKNGTFINNTELFPNFGYQPMAELVDRNERRRRDLPPPKRAHKLEDKRYYQQNIMGPGNSFIDFEATVSTSLDQTAIAPGYLQREWIEGERHFFHYKMDAPIRHYYAFLSARLEVQRDEHEGVLIEVFHHASHQMNVARMVEAIKDSIDYYSENFGPYQHRQARIIEFPGYRNFAQSFANTVPYSERIGFFSDLRDSDEVDSVYFVTAHEMAHQWWGGQVDGANVQGSTMLSESLAHYSALMVTEKKYGMGHARKILQFELDRYLRERTLETVEELALMRVENQQYIHYRKGVVVMASLRETLGEERLHNLLRQYLQTFKYKESPYPTTLDFNAFLNDGASATETAFIKSVFEEITLYDFKLSEVESNELDDGSYEIVLTIDAGKVSADGQGLETAIGLNELVDIALFSIDPDEVSATDKLLYLQKHMIKKGENIIKLIVPTLPKFAGIDPFVKFIDRDLIDNNKAI